MIHFGEILRNMRKGRDITQEQLADYLGVSSQAVSKWETNQSFPDITLLPALANFFEISVDRLLGVDVGKKKEHIEAICAQADALFAERQYETAVTLLRREAAEYPGNEELLYRLAWALTGTCRKHPENLDEAIAIYLKLLETCTDTDLRAKVTRDLVYRYYTKNDIAAATEFALQLPGFEVCFEYNFGRANLLAGGELAKCLKQNLCLFGNAMIECLEYFASPHDKIVSVTDMLPLTPEEARRHMESLREIVAAASA